MNIVSKKERSRKKDSTKAKRSWKFYTLIHQQLYFLNLSNPSIYTFLVFLFLRLFGVVGSTTVPPEYQFFNRANEMKFNKTFNFLLNYMNIFAS